MKNCMLSCQVFDYRRALLCLLRRVQNVFRGQEAYPTHDEPVVTEYRLSQHHCIHGHKTRCSQDALLQDKSRHKAHLVAYSCDPIQKDSHICKSLKSGWEFKQGRVVIVDKSADPRRYTLSVSACINRHYHFSKKTNPSTFGNGLCGFVNHKYHKAKS